MPKRKIVPATIALAVAAIASMHSSEAQTSTTTKSSPALRLAATPTPSPAAGLSAQHFVTTESGAQVTTLRNLGATSIIIVGGRPTTVGALRSLVRTDTLAHLGPPQSVKRAPHVMSGEIQGAGGLGSHAGRQSVTATTASSAAILAATKSPNSSLKTTQTSAVLPDPDYCKKNPPYILHGKGNITPGGYLVVDGVCFGASTGSISLIGNFKNTTSLALQVQHWDDGSITAAIPQITGVYDQTVSIQVVSGKSKSDGTPIKFVALRERVPLANHFITPALCDQTTAVGECIDGTGFRMELGNSWGGTDVWEAHAPAGWVLDSMDTRTGLGEMSYAGGFDQGPPDYAKFSIRWRAGVERSVTTTQTVAGFHVSSDTEYFYGSTYAITIWAIGPAGTMPQ